MRAHDTRPADYESVLCSLSLKTKSLTMLDAMQADPVALSAIPAVARLDRVTKGSFAAAVVDNLSDPSSKTTCANSLEDRQSNDSVKVDVEVSFSTPVAEIPSGVGKRKVTDDGSYSGGEVKKPRKGLYFEFAKKKWENEDSFKLPDGTFW